MTGEEIRMNEVLLEVKDLRTQFLTERGIAPAVAVYKRQIWVSRGVKTTLSAVIPYSSFDVLRL